MFGTFISRNFISCCMLFLLTGLCHGAIGFDPATNITIGNQPDTVAFGDFNNDKNLDMAVTSDAPDKVSVLLNLGGGSFGAPNHVFLPGGSSPQSVIAGDVNNDGNVDLVVSLKGTNTVQTYLNNGAASFSLGGTFSVGLEPRHMAAGDLDGINGLDLVTSNRDSNNVSVLLNNGAGAFSAAVNYAVGADPRAVTLGDFDGNLSLDIAVAAHDSREINVLSNLGNGGFSSATNLSVGAQLRPDGVTVADLNCDGDLDIAAATSGNGLNFVSVFIRVGANSFSGPNNFAVSGVNPSDIVAADFDVDGDPDLATVNPDSNNVSVLAGDGAGVFGSEILLIAGIAPDNLVAGDLDGNGSKELVSVNQDSNNVSVFINQNSAWTDLGFGLAGAYGIPTLSGTGTLEGGAPASLKLSGALENRPALFVVGLSRIDIPFQGGTFVPALDLLFFTSTGLTGEIELSSTWPIGVPKGLSYYFQYWIDDPSAIHGFSASNAMKGITQ